MKPRFLALAALLSGACSSSESPANTPTPDGSVAETSGDSATTWVWDGRPISPEITCGPGPYAEYSLQPYGRVIGESSKQSPYTRIKVSLSACPEVKAETDVEGYASLRLTIGKPVSIRLDADGWISTRTFEVTPQKWSEPPFLALISPEARPNLPGIDKGAVLVDVGAATGSIACTGPDGVKISVEGHPEAVVAYHAASKPFAPVAGATETTPSGIASISGIAPGTRIKIKGEKPGCDVVLNGAPGDVLVEANVVANPQLIVRDPYPSCGPPPWVILEGLLTTRETAGTAGTPIEGVSVSWSGCPGVTATTAKDGLWHAWVSTNLPSHRKYEKADFLTTFSAEQAWPVEYSKVDLALRNSATWRPLMPGYDDTHAYAAIGISAPTTGSCSGGQDVAIAIKGHPDAKVIYVDGDPPKDTGGKVTAKRGLVYVSGLTPGELTDENVTATREGCTYSLKGSIDTGRATLQAGAFTIATLYGKRAP